MQHGIRKIPAATVGGCATRPVAGSNDPIGGPQLQEIHPMQWQTPTATDFRFGFEISLYVAAR